MPTPDINRGTLSITPVQQDYTTEDAIYANMMKKIDAIIYSPLNLTEEEYIRELNAIQELKLAPRGQTEMVIRLRKNETVSQQYNTNELSKEEIPERLMQIKTQLIIDYNYSVFDIFISMLDKVEKERLPNLVKLGKG